MIEKKSCCWSKKKYRFFASLGHFDNFFFSYENIVEKKIQIESEIR